MSHFETKTHGAYSNLKINSLLSAPLNGNCSHLVSISECCSSTCVKETFHPSLDDVSEMAFITFCHKTFQTLAEVLIIAP